MDDDPSPTDKPPGRWLAFILSLIITISILLSCVHVQVERVTRHSLGRGHEGYAIILSEMPPQGQEAARITVQADLVNTEDRRVRHLLRKASLLGCDGVLTILPTRASTTGSCIVIPK